MKLKLTIGLLMISTPLWALNPDFENVYPEDHEVIERATGDLNDDGIADLVVVSRETDPSKIMLWGENETNLFNGNRLAFSVYFADDQAQNGFKLIAQSYDFLPPPIYPEFTDASFEGVEIKNRELFLSVHGFYSGGVWFSHDEGFKFRMVQGTLVLIGYESHRTLMGSSEEFVSVDFLTHKMERSKRQISQGESKPSKQFNISEQVFELNDFSAVDLSQFLSEQTPNEWFD